MKTDTDMDKMSPLLRFSPKFLRPYLLLMRLDRPVPFLLFLLPAFWGLLFIGMKPAEPFLFLVFATGAFLMRSAGCVINDLIDRDIDARVKRTQKRPLASGELSLKQGLICLGGLLSGALVLLFFLPLSCTFLALFLLLLMPLYPWMKRVTYWPQVFLGVVANWSLVMAFPVVEEPSFFKGGVLFLIGVGWTLFYDTLYAHQDKDDDLVIGVKSTALKLGSKTKPFLSQLIVTLSVFFAILFLNELYTFHKPMTYLYFFAMMSVLMGLGTLSGILQATDLSDPSSCLAGFKKTQYFGWYVLVGLILLCFSS